jgi:hypothetical protein
MVANNVGGDPIEPRPQRPLRVEPRPALVRRCERGRGQLVSKRRTDASAQIPVQDRKLGLEDRVERRPHHPYFPAPARPVPADADQRTHAPALVRPNLAFVGSARRVMACVRLLTPQHRAETDHARSCATDTS